MRLNQRRFIAALLLAPAALLTTEALADPAGQLRWLTLGDSYTVAEGLPASAGFGLRATQELKAQGFDIRPPLVIAQTGWNSSQLLSAIQAAKPPSDHDFVTLQIGVNNQFRGEPLAAGLREFEELLMQAITLAGQRSGRVAVLSIPDWSHTPTGREFAREPQRVSREIDAWNAAQRSICKRHGVLYIDITSESRRAQNFAPDGLHPGAASHASWAKSLASWMRTTLQAGTKTGTENDS